DETEKICPKCRRGYILSKTNYGNCQYHDGYIYDLQTKKPVSYDEAEAMLQATILVQKSSSNVSVPKLVWTCCLRIVGSGSPCRTGICGLPEELQRKPIKAEDQIKEVEKYFKEKTNATEKLRALEKAYNELRRS
ncbi:unnamed protein product, partial [Adineta ricciae]